jgi:tetratricopeptide (TPR) repeat protein
VLIFHMLSGTVPFKSHNPMSTIREAVAGPFPEITSRNPSLPKLLDSLLLKGTAKNPYDRFGDVMELAQMVTAVLSSAELQDTSDLGVRKHRIAIVPFASEEPDRQWMGDAVQEMLNLELSQSKGLFTLPPDHVSYICRNLLEPNSNWTSGPLQRFFDLSRADYMILGKVGKNQIEYELKISTSFETIDQQTVEGTIPFHLVSEIGKRIKTKIQTKDNRFLSVEQIFHGNLSLLEQYAIGIRKFRDGMFVDAERAMRLALTFEPTFSPAHIYVSRALAARGLTKQSRKAAETALLYISELPGPLSTLGKAKCFELIGKFKEASDIYSELHKQSPHIFEYLDLLSESLMNAGKPDDAATVCYQICEMEAKSGFGWRRLATIESMQEKYEQAWYHFKRAERLYQSREHYGGLAACYSGLAGISKKRNEWETAIDYLKRSIDAFSKLKWAKGVARSKYELALAYKKQSAFQEVVPLLSESLKLFEEIGDYSGQVLCLRELLAEPIEIREALELSDRAFQLASEMDEPLLTASLVPLKLRWLVEAQQPDSALEFYASHYQLLIATSQELYFPLSQIQITRALMQQYRYQEARQQIEQPLQTFTIMGNQYCLSNAMMVSGELHLQENDLNAAHQYLDEAGAIAERLNDNELSLEVNLIRARLLRAEGETVPLLQLYLNTATLAENLGRHQLAQKIHASINELKV